MLVGYKGGEGRMETRERKQKETHSAVFFCFFHSQGSRLGLLFSLHIHLHTEKCSKKLGSLGFVHPHVRYVFVVLAAAGVKPVPVPYLPAPCCFPYPAPGGSCPVPCVLPVLVAVGAAVRGPSALFSDAELFSLRYLCTNLLF